MKNLFIALFVLIVGLPASGQAVKRVKITDIEQYIQKSERPLIISFWATWCVPCLKEIPWFEEQVKKYADKNPELLLVSLDFAKSYPKQLTDFVKKRNFVATVFWLDETNADYFCPKIDAKWSGGIPATLFVNKKTNYRNFFERQLTPLQVEREIKALVKE